MGPELMMVEAEWWVQGAAEGGWLCCSPLIDLKFSRLTNLKGKKVQEKVALGTAILPPPRARVIP